MKDRSLVRRAGGAAALSAVIASLVTLLVAMLIVDRRVVHDAEDEALARAHAFVRELDDEAMGEQGVDDRHLQDEVAEFSHGSSKLTVMGPSGRAAGAADVPELGHDGCGIVSTSAPHGGEPWLVCRATSTIVARWALVGEPYATVVGHRQSLLAGGMVALAIVALGGVIAGIVVGRWSLRPLVELRRAVGSIDVRDHRRVQPLPRSGLSELDTLATALEDVFGRLRDELERSQLFAADAAHELRTPLAKLRAELELLVEDSVGEQTSLLERQVARIEDLAALVDQLLVLASPESSLRGAAHVSIAAVVESVLDDLDGAERVALELADDGAVLGDAHILAAVISNALGNALKFSTGPVLLGLRTTNDEVVLRIDDDGPGLSDDERARAFEGFYRGSAHRNTRGHGIGLALIAHVVQAHEGSVYFVGETPGAHLVIRLPAHGSAFE
ncbi:MAG: HAMP domain-containing sensor histidine kinase [Polyangiaceae bacterium]